MNITFSSVGRMDWGFGNPNITAALIVSLFLLAWLPAFLLRKGFWFSLPASTFLGVCLIHTMSRGGILGGIVGLGLLIYFAPRPWPRSRLVAASVCIWITIFGTVFFNTHKRIGQGITNEDMSISNRLTVWQAAPQMLAANPKGWGWNKSGQAYMDWFQPLDREEQYGSLVNTHLSKIVELGIVGGSIYLFAWSLALILSWPTTQKRWRAVPFAILAGFGTAAIFTNMAREPLVWIVPACSLLWVIADIAISRTPLNLRLVVASSTLSIALLLVLYLIGLRSPSSLYVVNNAISLGPKPPQLWLLASRDKLGSSYPRKLRRFISDHSSTVSVAVAESVQDLPKEIETPLLIARDTTDEERSLFIRSAKQNIVLIMPNFPPLKTNSNQPMFAIFGEFSHSPFVSSWKMIDRYRMLQGVGDFIPNWTEIVHEFLNQEKHTVDSGIIPVAEHDNQE